jgi:hypothetical protein
MRRFVARIFCLTAAAGLFGGLATRADAQEVRILQVGDTLTAPGIKLIAGEIQGSGTPTKFVLRVPSSSQLSSDHEAMQALVDLGQVVQGGRPVLVVDPANTAGTTATVLSQFAQQPTVLLPGAALGDINALQLPAEVRAAFGCQGNCPAVQASADAAHLNAQLAQAPTVPAADGGVTLGALATPDDSPPSNRTTDDDSGFSLMLPVVVLLVMAAVAAVLLRARRRGSRRPPPGTGGLLQPGSGDRVHDRPIQPRPKGRPVDRVRPPRPTGPVVPSGARARVQSEFHPDGYVAVDNYVVRATWADAASPPPTAGDWVELEPDGSRLLAHRPGAPHRSKRKR